MKYCFLFILTNLGGISFHLEKEDGCKHEDGDYCHPDCHLDHGGDDDDDDGDDDDDDGDDNDDDDDGDDDNDVDDGDDDGDDDDDDDGDDDDVDDDDGGGGDDDGGGDHHDYLHQSVGCQDGPRVRRCQKVPVRVRSTD